MRPEQKQQHNQIQEKRPECGGRASIKAPFLYFLYSLAALSVLPVSAQADWPMWLRDTTGAAKSSDGQIQQPATAEAVWTSEAVIPPGRVADSRRAASNEESPHSGGFASPIVGDGVIYQFHYRPSGEVYDSNVVKKRLKTSQEALRKQRSAKQEGNLIFGHERWLIGATDILTAIDAETGKTLWQTDLGDQGINWNMFSKGGPLNTPAYADGRVFVVGTAGDLYAVDAETGRVLWQGDLGWRTRQMRDYRQGAEELRHIAPRFSRDFLSSVVVVDGVVLANDQRRHNVNRGQGREYFYEPMNGYVAFDAESGEQLWAEPDIAGDSTPAIWHHQGKNYLLGDHLFRLSLRDLRSGEVIWEVPFGHSAAYRPALGEDILVINERAGRDDRDTQITGYRISLRGLEPLWKWDEDKSILGNLLISRGKGYVLLNRDEDNLICFDPETGRSITSIDVPRLGGQQDNAFLLAYGDWLVMGNGKHNQGFNFIPADPAQMSSGPQLLPTEHAIAYHVALLPAFADGKLFVRTPRHIKAFRLE
ncbi:MAG: PQQ-binding-like beta-propeller repeat protein [Opitutales bacterium]